MAECEAVTVALAPARPDRLDKLLLERLDQQRISRAQLKKLIEQGAVTVADEVVTKAGFLIKHPCTAVVQVPIEPGATEIIPYEFALSVLHEDAAVIVIDKPKGLVVHPGAGNRTTTLVNALAARKRISKAVATKARYGIVHRLDKDTSGVLVVAKTVAAHAHLSKQFAAHTTRRIYAAMVTYLPRSDSRVRKEDTGVFEGNLARDERNRLKMAVVDEGGRRAVTRWSVKERFTYGAYLHLKLETGRTHQIRAHLEHLGAPVIGDPLYTDGVLALPTKLQKELEQFPSQLLHAHTLEFEHPDGSSGRLRFSSPLPAAFEEAKRILREF